MWQYAVGIFYEGIVKVIKSLCSCWDTFCIQTLEDMTELKIKEGGTNFSYENIPTLVIFTTSVALTLNFSRSFLIVNVTTCLTVILAGLWLDLLLPRQWRVEWVSQRTGERRESEEPLTQSNWFLSTHHCKFQFVYKFQHDITLHSWLSLQIPCAQSSVS